MKRLLFQPSLFGNIPNGITNGSLAIMECTNSEADKIICRHHYSHKATKNRFKSFSVNNGKGYLQLGYGIRPKMKYTISALIRSGNYCEFDRMWLSDELPSNSESQTIGLLLSYIKQAYPNIKFIITYADESVGNQGIIYQATNAIEIDSVPVDFYILPSGERLHPVSMYHRHKTRAKAFVEKQYPGIMHIKSGYRQRRYLYILHNGMRKKFQERNAAIRAEGLVRFQPSAPILTATNK